MIYRLFAVVEKELKTLLRDKTFLVLIFLAPLISLMVFGYTFQGNIDNLPTIIIDEDNSNFSKEIIIAAQNSEYFKVLFINTLSSNESFKKLKDSEVRAIIHIKKGFGESLDNATMSNIFFYVDSSDYMTYNTLKAAIGGVIKDSLQEISLKLIGDLELEKEENVKKVDEVKKLSGEIEEKTDSIKTKIDDMDTRFSTFRSMLNDSREDVKNAKNELGDIESDLAMFNITIDFDLDKIFDFDKYESNLDENEIISDELKLDSDELFAKYENVTEINERIDLQFKTLKKEFLTHPIELKDSYLFGKISYFTYLTAGIISLILFSLCVLTTCVSIMDEKEKKTLFRIVATPTKKYELITGKFIVFSAFGFFVGIYTVLFTTIFFNVPYQGSIFSLLFIISLFATVCVSMGLLVSVMARTLRQALIILPSILLPLMFMSQTFAPIEVMPKFMQHIAKFIPNFYANVALRKIMIKGASLISVWQEIVILIAFTFVLLTLSTLLMKKRIT